MQTAYRPIIICCIVALINSIQIVAQNIAITPGKVKTEEGQEVDGWIAHPEQPVEYVTKSFDGFLKNMMQTKTSRKMKNVLIVEKLKVEEISPLRGDLRAVVYQGDNGTEIGISFSPGYDIHFDPRHYPKEYAKMESLARKYVKYHYTEFYKDQSAKTTKEITSQKNNASKLEERINKLKDEMTLNEKKAADGKESKATEKNAKLQLEIDKFTRELTKVQETITKQEETLTQISASQKKVSEL